jgi:uncharacterized membrane protein
MTDISLSQEAPQDPAGGQRLAAPTHHEGRMALASVAGNERINAFCDGVFAVAITILVLGIQVPDIPVDRAAVELGPALLKMLPQFAGHVVSFAILGIYWVGHHNQLLHVRRHDRTYLWLTILFLLCVATMPFPTALLIRYHTQQIAVIVYASGLIVTGLALDLLWWYATRRHHLVSASMEPEFIRFVHRRVLTAPMFYAVAIAVSFISVTLAELIFAITAIYYIIPNPFDQYHHRNVHRLHAESTETPGE